MAAELDEVQQFWEQHYGRADRIWSSRVNVRLAELVSALKPGRALDLGCGEGADAMWLAKHGWQVVAVDVSRTALQRAVADAQERNLLDRIDFQHRDLSESFPDGTFDLVSAQFFQSPVRLERTAVLRRAAESLAPGGVLLVVDHGSAPPWSLHQDHRFPSIAEVLADLPPDNAGWHRVRAEGVQREVIGPGGERATLTDNVIVLRREDRQAAS
ncbi:bifunctional 2-polyprenyl-6-hydroxyphenol methylase/3-demethylubiquinol 3-O-methyltransferase UbiG [Mycobacterium sp. MFM001]|uniref:class I SAM-dependent methyltransferase n=1 Tax=Mycobacterium sp. MFM001 TaxID=2049453 RepID=UPI000E2FC991|nr:class I SAM-dependent methyltransferase [Mycobacterium sp. MFM001]